MKHIDWQAQLDAFIESRRNLPHAYGSNDCCLFAADAIMAQTGDDMAKDFRGTYSTQAEADKILADRGGLEAFVTSFLGDKRGGNNACRGDIVLFNPFPDKEAIGVCVDAQHFVCPGDTQLVFFRLSKALASWRVA